MTIKINIKLLEEKIPIDYRRMILHLIKSVIEKEDKALFEQYYSTTKQKPFTFWAKLPKPIFTDNYIELEKPEFTFYISTNNTKLAFVLFNGFKSIQNKKIDIGNTNKLSIVCVRNVKDKQQIDNEIIINMLSPLVCRKHIKGEIDNYFLFNEDGFLKYLMINLSSKFYISDDNFKIEPIKCRKTVVKAYGTKIPSSLGVLKLSGDVNLLNDLYLLGLGSKTSAGFGKFEIIG